MSEKYIEPEPDKIQNFELIRRNADRDTIADRLTRSIGVDHTLTNVYAAFNNELHVLLGDIYACMSLGYINEGQYAALADSTDQFSKSEIINNLKRENKEDERQEEIKIAFEEVVKLWQELSENLN